jgi:two-component system, chemotaxis family, CheB/CheR fusion protein
LVSRRGFYGIVTGELAQLEFVGERMASLNDRPGHAELNHRMRRVLSVFRSLAAHMMANTEDPDESLLHLVGRVSAISRAAIAPVVGGIDLESLILDELLAQGVTRAPIQISGPIVFLNAKSAELMSLVIHELTTNSIKFGALSQSNPQLRVAWRLEDKPPSRLHFEWSENSVRIAADAERKGGFGSELVKRWIAREVGGEGKLQFLGHGIICSIDIPVSEALHKE